ncbi:MAG: tetratricopeptide repeat protein [Spirochaetota bacterium]|nr:MAG: tetratricopeptide repeat protein [Spirochaetota bacterium]
MFIVIFIVLAVLVLVIVGVLFFKARQKRKYERAGILYKNGRFEEALKLFQELLAKNPRKKIYFWNIGLCYEQLGNYEMALVEFNKLALSTSFDSSLKEVDIHNKIALLNLKINNIDKAWKEFQIVASIDPEHAESFYNLGLISVRKSDYQRAMDYFEKACQYREQYPESWLELGKVYLKQNYFEKARKALINVITQRPSLTEAHFNYAIVLEKERSYKQSIEEFQQAAEDNRFRFHSMVHLGNIYISLNNKEMAFDYFEKALAFGTVDNKELIETKYRYANYLIGSGNINKALKLWREIDSVQTGYKDVKNKIDIYGEINKSSILSRFITMNKQDFIETSKSLCKKLKVKIEKADTEKKDFVEFVGTFRVGRDEMTCIVDIARWINKVGEIPIRELLERMNDRGASKSIFVTSSTFTQKALDLSNIRPVELIDKDRLEHMLEEIL